jgi:hypothetical protein
MPGAGNERPTEQLPIMADKRCGTKVVALFASFWFELPPLGWRNFRDASLGTKALFPIDMKYSAL